jgi:hypothetical protein
MTDLVAAHAFTLTPLFIARVIDDLTGHPTLD